MIINRYVIRVSDRKVLKHAKIGDLIFTDSQDIDDAEPVGFIGNIFKETRSMEVCLLKPININRLKVQKRRILYYESNYDVHGRFREMKKQGIIKC